MPLFLRPLRYRAGGAALAMGSACLALAGCATGSTTSVSQAPIFFSDGQGGFDDLNAAARAGALSPGGDFRSGVPAFTAVGGNAILPIDAPAGLGAEAGIASSVVAGALGSDATIVAGVAGAAATTIASTGATVTSTLATPVATAAALTAPTVAAATGAAAVAPVASVLSTPAPARTLVTQGAILSSGSAALANSTAAAAAVNALLVSTAIQQQKPRMCGPLKPTC